MPRSRLDLREAAEVLDTSVDAVRKRIARGTLEAEKVDGKVYVWLDDGAPRSDTDALISETRAHAETLREELEAERQAHAETRRLLAAALERIPPQLEPPTQETPKPPERATEQPGRVEPQPSVEGAQEAAERQQDNTWFPQRGESINRPWWRRMFGG
jgi:hypothetical protein